MNGPWAGESNLSQRFERLIRSGERLERVGVPFPIQRFLSLHARLLAWGDPSRITELVQLGEGLLEARYRQLRQLHAAERGIPELRTLASRLDSGTSDPTTAGPEARLGSSREESPRSTATWDERVQERVRTFQELRQAVLARCVREGLRIGERARGSPASADPSGGTARRLRDLVTAVREGDLAAGTESVLALREIHSEGSPAAPPRAVRAGRRPVPEVRRPNRGDRSHARTVPSPRRPRRGGGGRPVPVRHRPFGLFRAPETVGRRGLRYGVSVALTVVMLLAAYTAVADAHAAPTPPTISVTGLASQTARVGRRVTVTADISGGITDSATQGVFSGYLVFFFYGQTTSSGGLGYDKQIVSAPDCTTVDTPCDSPVSVSFSYTYEHPGSYDTSLTVYDAAGDYAIATEVVNVLPPVVTVKALASSTPSTPTTEDSPIQFSASVSTVPTSYKSDTFAYQWLFGDNTSGWGNPIAHAYDDSGNYVVTVRAYDNSTGAVNQTSISNIVVTNPPPNPVLTVVTPPSVSGSYPEDSSISFSASQSTDVPSDIPLLHYLWAYGDGTFGTGVTASHQYTESGTYVVQLTVTDEEGIHISTSKDIQISNSPPLASAAATPSAPVSVGNVALFNGSDTYDVPTDLPLLNYSWNSEAMGPAVPVTDMGSSFGIIGRDGYFEPGDYSTTLLVSDEGSAAQTATATAGVHVVDTPPNAGVYSMYTLANLSLSVKGTPGITLNVSVMESGRLIAGGDITRTSTGPSGDVLVLSDVPLSLADTDTIDVSYVLPIGGTLEAANPVDLTVSFWGDGPGCAAGSLCHAQLYTHDFIAHLPSTDSWNVSGNVASLGQLVFLGAQVFSPAWTSLTTQWNFGDGTSATSFTYAPMAPEPTLASIATTHRWLPGSNYQFTISTQDAYGGTNSSSVEVYEVGAAGVSDIAPVPTLAIPGSTVNAPSTNLPVIVASQNYAASAFALDWQFGDGQGASQPNAPAITSETHFFRYSATTYAVVVYATDEAGGPATVDWSFLDILNTPPIPQFSVAPGSVIEFQPVTFSASQSLDYSGATPGGNLSYAWDFGTSTQSYVRGAGVSVTRIFTSEGTFSVKLTVTDDEGLSASVTEPVSVAALPTYASLPARTVTVDELATFAPTFPSGVDGAPTDNATMTGTWNWGDMSGPSYGLTAAHTYLSVGTFHQTLTLMTEDGTVDTLTATVTVVDQPLTVSLPYDGFTVYGENHTVPFTATVLGSAADEAAGPNAFTYYWNYGDGVSAGPVTGGLSDTAFHTYTSAGNANISVIVEGPNGTTGNASASLILVPNWDGDGVPDMYATLFHLPVGNEKPTGTGLTDFMSRFVVQGLNSSADTDHDGLTDFQEVFGTVTGYVSNPLDPNTAGDGIQDGSHQFIDSFSASQVVSFTGSGSVTIPNVQHDGSTAAISQIELYVEIVSSDLSSLTLNLGPSGGNSVSLGSPADAVANYTLLTNTPDGGPVSQYSLLPNEFVSPSDWVLSVSGGSGTIEMAQILVYYYTNPNLADPYRSGLTLGQGFSIPVFNVTEPQDANYTVFHGESMTYSTVYYYPYTEQYYKLSVVQGLPYFAWDNASYQKGETGVPDPQAFATYYGDKQFGLLPWQVNPPGDTGLTVGMKAYGRTNYTLTANHYLDAQVANQYDRSVAPPPYPADTIGYPWPLNPTAFSTGTNGVADSQSVNPTGGPEVFLVSISSAWTVCVEQGYSLANKPSGQGAMSNLDVTGSNGPATMWSAAVKTDDYSYCSGMVGFYYQWHFSWSGADFQLPVDTSQSTNTIELGAYFTDAATNSAGGAADFTVSTTPGASSTLSYGTNCESGTLCIRGSVTTVALGRMPVTLVNSTGEIQQLPGYGDRWSGDQHFYAFYINVNDSGTGTSLHPGQNLVLVSRTAFGNSTLNQTLSSGDTSAAPYLDGATFYQRGTSSAIDVVGTMSLSLDSQDANLFLASLIPHNAAGGVTGAIETLTQTQFELLGLSDPIMHSAPYFPYPSNVYSTTSNAPPTTFFGKVLNALTLVWDAIVSVIVALVDFVAAVVQAIGQAIIGLWSHFVSAVQSAVHAIVSALDFVLKWVEQQLSALLSTVGTAVKKWIGQVIAAVALPFLSLLVDVGDESVTEFQNQFTAIDHKFGITDPAPLISANATREIETAIEVITGLIAGVMAIIGIVLYAADIASLGTATSATATASASVSAVVTGIIAAVFAAIGGLAAIFQVLQLVVPNFGGTDAFTGFLNYTASEVSNTQTKGLVVNTIVQEVIPILQLVTDGIRALVVSSIAGAYFVGLGLSVLSLVASGLSIFLAGTIFGSTIALIVLSAIGVVLGAAGAIVQFYPTTTAAVDASQTGMGEAAGKVIAIGSVILGIGNLVNAISSLSS